MSELLTNFKDDILAESMEGRRRYQMITNEDGTVSFVDVTEYAQIGSEFGQAEVNAIHREINNKFDSDDVVAPLAAAETGLAADAKLTGDAIREVSAKILSFEQAKSTIINSALGKALGLTANMAFTTVASKIAGVANRGAWTNTITTANGKATIPAGYHNGSGYIQVSGLYVPPTSLSGSVTLSIPTNSMWQEVSKVITFSSPFMSVPSVSLGWSDTTYKYTGGVRNVSKTGFTIYYSPNANRGAYTVTASWVARES